MSFIETRKFYCNYLNCERSIQVPMSHGGIPKGWVELRRSTTGIGGITSINDDHLCKEHSAVIADLLEEA